MQGYGFAVELHVRALVAVIESHDEFGAVAAMIGREYLRVRRELAGKNACGAEKHYDLASSHRVPRVMPVSYGQPTHSALATQEKWPGVTPAIVAFVIKDFQFTCTPLALIGVAHFTISLLTNSPR